MSRPGKHSPEIWLNLRKIFALAFTWLATQNICLSQSDSLGRETSVYDSIEIRYDSAKATLFKQVRQFGDSLKTRNRLEFIEDTIATRQAETIALIKKLALEARAYLDNGVDTTGLTAELNKIEHWYDITSDGVLVNRGSLQTHRNLETSYKIMRELLVRVTTRNSALDQYYKRLVHFRNTIDSLRQQDVLYAFSSDSSLLMRYVEQLVLVSHEIRPIDSSLKRAVLNVSELQPPINMLANKLSTSIDHIRGFQEELSANTFRAESNELWKPAAYSRPFIEIFRFSMRKAALSFIFYVRNELSKISLLLLLIGGVTAFLVRLKKTLSHQFLSIGKTREQVVLRYPFLSAVFMVLNIFQFIFIDPPFLFSALAWTISGIALTIILRGVVNRYWWRSWLLISVLAIFTCFDNLLLQASRPERWFMAGLAVLSILLCSTIMLRGLRSELKEKSLRFFIAIAIVLQLVSLITNSYGYYNLSKTSLTAGTMNVVLAILFFWALYFVTQSLALSSRAYDKPNRRLFNSNFEFAGGKAPPAFYILLFSGWFILFGRNFYVFKSISEPVKTFIAAKRSIGEFSFTFGDLLGFFIVLYVTGLVSRVVTALASQGVEKNTGARKPGFGSWVLVIRICVISIGLLAAFAVIGVPMDRLTIILSALSVGVGFGLQSLVNNLVSGLIISFERPISVGDVVEIGSQQGVVKSIGLRSSIIRTPAGATVVVPNGDLLNHHLLNWTHENLSRSVGITLYVQHGTDLDLAIKLLKALPEEDKRIITVPAPTVVIRQFNRNSVELELSFWIRNLAEYAATRSDIILAIDLAFRKNGITMTFPLQEVLSDVVGK